MLSAHLTAFLGLILAITLPFSSSAAPCLNQLQVLGTHSSYHALPAQTILDLLNGPIGQTVLPDTAFLPQAWEYSHPSLTEQLDAGVRALELDVHPDPDGGLFSAPAMLKFAGVSATLPDPALAQPGFKVLHIPDIDFSSSCNTLVACLKLVRDWSIAHPDHVPITITVETSFGETELSDILGDAGRNVVNIQLEMTPEIAGPSSLTTPPEVSPELLGSLEAEILSIFPPFSLITPDSVKTALNVPASTNIAQVLLQPPSSNSCPWPDLESLRGKVMFGFILPSSAAVDAYKQLHPNQEGAVGWLVWDSFFIEDAVMASVAVSGSLSEAGGVLPPAIPSNAADLVAAMVKDVEDKVGAGYLVRARADVDTIEARSTYTARATALLNSPAQVVSSDFVVPDRVFETAYRVSMSGGLPARCVKGAEDAGYAGAEVNCSGSDNVSNNSPAPAAAVDGDRSVGAAAGESEEEKDAEPRTGPIGGGVPSAAPGAQSPTALTPPTSTGIRLNKSLVSCVVGLSIAFMVIVV